MDKIKQAEKLRKIISQELDVDLSCCDDGDIWVGCEKLTMNHILSILVAYFEGYFDDEIMRLTDDRLTALLSEMETIKGEITKLT